MKILCRLRLILDDGTVKDIDWAWKDAFNDFLVEAIKTYPNVVHISRYWGGDELSLMQGDLHYATWKKRNGKWHKVKCAESHEAYYPPILVPSPELDEIASKYLI